MIITSQDLQMSDFTAKLKHFFFGGGGTPHLKGVGMLVFSLRGVNFGFWSHLGCSG